MTNQPPGTRGYAATIRENHCLLDRRTCRMAQHHQSRALTVTGRTPVSIPLSASPGPVTYSAEGLPPGLTLNAATGVISGSTPDARNYTPLIRASNAVGTAALRLQLLVTPGTGMPVITNALAINGTLGGLVDFQLSGSNAPVFSSPNLPEGLSIQSPSNKLTGRFRTAGTYYGTLVATNAMGQTSTQVLFTVSADFAGWVSLFALGAPDSAPAADPDGDGFSNLLEYLSNTSPGSAASRPVLERQEYGLNSPLRHVGCRITQTDPSAC